jgi:DNA polymerase-1
LAPPVVVVPEVVLARPPAADQAVSALRSLAAAAAADGPAAEAAVVARTGDVTVSADGAGTAEVMVMAGRWHGDAGRSLLRGVAVARVAVSSDAAPEEASDAAPDPGSDQASVDASVDASDVGVGDGVWLHADLLAVPSVAAALGDLVGPGRLAVAGHGLKELMRSLLPLGIDIGQVRLDTEVAVGLLDPAAGRRTVDDVVAAWLGRSGAGPSAGPGARAAGDATAGPDVVTAEQTALSFGPGPAAGAVAAAPRRPPASDGAGSDGAASGGAASGRAAAEDAPADDAASGGAASAGAASDTAAAVRALEDAAVDLAAVAGELGAVAATVPVLEAALAAEGLTRLHELVERPLVRVLARMEVVGIGVDVAELQRIADAMAAEGQRLHDEVQRLAGVRFNVNSTPQLREVLFGTLGLKPQRRTKTGYSTDAQTLERLRDAHPVVDTLLRYREVEKLRSTYGTSLLAEVADDGRIHATFHQIGARTGRLSSDRPNLHNIPVRTEEGLALRRAFVAAPGHLLLVADYDQIELRVIAHLAGDPGLRQAFAEGRDVHRATAARVFGVPEDEVTPEQRSRAKMVSYGLAYGMEAYGLAQRLRIGTDEARAILAAYFRAFPAVEAYMAEVVRQARQRGHTETALGRRRPLPDLLSANRGLRQAAERQAMNAAVQGLAADLFKLALVRLDEVLGDPALGGARLVLQVHDEVVVECPERSADAVEAQVVDVLGGVGAEAGLTVPLVVSTGRGRSWADAKR